MMKSCIIVGWTHDSSGLILKHRNERYRAIEDRGHQRFQEDQRDDVEAQTK